MNSDLDLFRTHISHAKLPSEPTQVIGAGRSLVDGALYIRRGGDGLFGDTPRPITKPAQALDAWLGSLERSALSGDFRRHHELREALIAAGEEIDTATQAMPRAARLRAALLHDASDVLGHSSASTHTFWPWLIAAALGGVTVGLLLRRK